ncbi:MAG: YraN family protein [Fusobacteriia bacterium 4572_132]|nr:MAG: YraN family protein [Fusobacteriia bacterium 4572_132]
MQNKRKIGTKWELIAEEEIIKKNYEILKKNYYSPYGEIDIIAKKEKMIIFVEVKYRKNKKYGYGEEAVTKTKQKRMYYTAMDYIMKKKLKNINFRFDIIAINNGKINWIKNSIWGDEIGL